MNNLIQLTKLIVILGIGVLVGQFIYITFNTSKYLEKRECQPEVVTSPLIAPVRQEEVKEVQSVVEGDNWLDEPARNR